MFSTSFASFSVIDNQVCTVFDSILSNTDGVLSINPFPNAFIFGDLNVHYKE